MILSPGVYPIYRGTAEAQVLARYDDYHGHSTRFASTRLGGKRTGSWNWRPYGHRHSRRTHHLDPPQSRGLACLGGTIWTVR